MQALVFGVDAGFTAPEPTGDNPLLANLASTPMDLRELPDPRLRGDDWLVLQSRLTGICGSDSKQVFLDTGGDATDFAMTAFISFPQVLGHEVVADVVERGSAVRDLEVGQRVVLQCWLSCAPRGITPVCPACAAGDYPLCWHFTDGSLTAGIHTGNSSDATGGFAERLPAHWTQAIPIPDAMTDEVAVLADPFAVSLHAVTRHPPRPGGHALVWGAGALGISAVAVLRALYPDVAVAVAARHPAQQALAGKLGATVFDSELDREDLVVALADWSGGRLHRPWAGLPIAQPGGIEVAYDTIGAPHTIELMLRVLASRASLVVSGVHAGARYEWSPQYFKEINLVGSNAFGIEEVEGVRQHAIQHYLDLVQDARVDLSGMLTHTFRLAHWREAFTTIAKQHETGAIKVVFDFR